MLKVFNSLLAHAARLGRLLNLYPYSMPWITRLVWEVCRRTSAFQ
jgi:hypothetical protein